MAWVLTDVRRRGDTICVNISNGRSDPHTRACAKIRRKKVRKVGDWSRARAEVYVPLASEMPCEKCVTALSAHEVGEKHLVQKHGLSYKGAHAIMENREEKYSRSQGIDIDKYQALIEKIAKKREQ